MIEVNFGADTIVLLLTFIVSTGLPLLVGVVTTQVTSPVRKALALVGLTFATSILSEVLNALVTQTPYDLIDGLFKFGGIFVISIATYFGVWSRADSTGVSLTTKLQEKVGVVAK